MTVERFYQHDGDIRIYDVLSPSQATPEPWYLITRPDPHRKSGDKWIGVSSVVFVRVVPDPTPLGLNNTSWKIRSLLIKKNFLPHYLPL